MLRRLVLVGVFVEVQRGSILQIVGGTIFCAIFLLLQMNAAPYHDKGDDYLANACSFSLLVFCSATPPARTRAAARRVPRAARRCERGRKPTCAVSPGSRVLHRLQGEGAHRAARRAACAVA